MLFNPSRTHSLLITMTSLWARWCLKAQPHDCLLNRWFRHRSKKTSKLHITGLCEGNSPVTSEFPAQRASNVGNVSIWWRHHDVCDPNLGFTVPDGVSPGTMLTSKFDIFSTYIFTYWFWALFRVLTSTVWKTTTNYMFQVVMHMWRWVFSMINI